MKIFQTADTSINPLCCVCFFSFSLQLMRGKTQNAFGATALYKEYNQFSIIAFGRLAGCQAAAK